MSETILSDAPSPQTEQPAGKARRFWSRLGQIFLRQREASVLAVVIVLFIYFGISNANFVSIQNVGTIGQFVAPVAIVATGEVFLLICGEIDISVGSVFAFAPFVMYLLNQDGVPMWLSIRPSSSVTRHHAYAIRYICRQTGVVPQDGGRARTDRSVRELSAIGCWLAPAARDSAA